MIRVEFHCHTEYSEDSLTTPQELLDTCRRKNIDRVVITDHNTVRGALAAQQIDPSRVIIGEEIMTTAGELLAAFVQEEIPEGLEPKEALTRLQSQGAFISVSHPFDRFRSEWTRETLLKILPLLDAIETFNARSVWPGFNWQAQAFARQHNLPGTSGSDAHTAAELGAATLLMDDFQDAAALRRVVRGARPRNHLSGFWVHFDSRRAVQVKRQMAEMHHR